MQQRIRQFEIQMTDINSSAHQKSIHYITKRCKTSTSNRCSLWPSLHSQQPSRHTPRRQRILQVVTAPLLLYGALDGRIDGADDTEAACIAFASPPHVACRQLQRLFRTQRRRVHPPRTARHRRPAVDTRAHGRHEDAEHHSEAGAHHAIGDGFEGAMLGERSGERVRVAADQWELAVVEGIVGVFVEEGLEAADSWGGRRGEGRGEGRGGLR